MNDRLDESPPAPARDTSTSTAGSVGRKTVLAAVAAALLAACTPGAPSITNPAGPGARTINTLWWVMFGVATFVCVLIAALLAFAIFKPRSPDLRESPPWARRMVYGGGFVFPL